MKKITHFLIIFLVCLTTNPSQSYSQTLRAELSEGLLVFLTELNKVNNDFSSPEVLLETSLAAIEEHEATVLESTKQRIEAVLDYLGVTIENLNLNDNEHYYGNSGTNTDRPEFYYYLRIKNIEYTFDIVGIEDPETLYAVGHMLSTGKASI